jgi:hypothetical protein
VRHKAHFRLSFSDGAFEVGVDSMPPPKRVQQMLANSAKQPLLDHLQSVALVGRAMAEACGLTDPSLLSEVEAAGWTHDIGKAIKPMQDILVGKKSADPDFEGPLHHEISWAFLASKFGPFPTNKRILGAVYWHHARPFGADGSSYETRDEILSALKKEDLRRLDLLFSALPLAPFFRADEHGTDLSEEDPEVPALFVADGDGSKNENARQLVLRTCVIAADRLVSSLTLKQVSALVSGKTKAVDLVGSLSGSLPPISVSAPKNYGRKRFDLQVKAASDAAETKTCILRAPAGFGKTLCGLLWLIRLGRPALWVTPRNVVAEAVYRNLCEEIDALGLDLSIELHLTGERKRSRGERGEFACDIVVTNIDTILAPMVENRTADRLFRILSAPMVLDEFHELVGDSPLFAAFVTLMRARHRFCGPPVKTLLCSATPSCMEDLWDTDGNTTFHLPSKEAHLPPAHEGRYKILWKKPGKNPKQGLLKVCNAVASAQRDFAGGEYSVLAHSRFTDDDRQAIMQFIYDRFGKGGAGVDAGDNVVAALVIQAAMDVSFSDLEDTVCSPEFSLQRIGRTDRWGTLQERAPSVAFILEDSANDGAAVATIYSSELRELWVSHLRKQLPHGSAPNLRDVYAVYNAFYAKHRVKVAKFIRDCYASGITDLRKYYFPKKPRGGAPLQAQGRRAVARRSLRNPLGAYYFTVRRASGGWLGPDEVMDEGPSLPQRFHGKSANMQKLLRASSMRTILKQLVRQGYRRFRRYTTSVPSSSNRWFALARNADTPLPDFTRTYDEKFGLRENRHITTP